MSRRKTPEPAAPQDEPACDLSPSCDEWLAGSSAVEPDHLCTNAAFDSVVRFMREQPIPPDGFDHPHEMTAAAVARTGPLYCDGEDVLPPTYPALLPYEEDLRLFAVARREFPDGTVARLLMLATPHWEDGERPHSRPEWYVIKRRHLVVEGHLAPEVAKIIGRLQQWFDRVLLGQRVPTGRLPGHSDAERAAFKTHAQETVARLKAQGRRITRGNFASEYPRAMDEKTVAAWARGLGFSDTRSFLQDLANR